MCLNANSFFSVFIQRAKIINANRIRLIFRTLTSAQERVAPLNQPDL